ncbi:hypothetical protein PIB30_088025 [Stylosanthes scabra]|uniref:Uncharacterized protein n=1 Tax=Stylosanthes scabra TaxID=79078 RepID=A0ABU6UW48_9FABA|nr:hypothetical protein [Stylosanthes scabra]
MQLVKGIEDQGFLMNTKPYPTPSQQPHGEGTSQWMGQQIQQGVNMQTDNNAEQRENSMGLSFSVNQEQNLQQANMNIILEMDSGLNKTNFEKHQTNQQEQTSQESMHQAIPIKELLKQAFKNIKTGDEDPNSDDIWNFREKPKLRTDVDDRGRRIIQMRTAVRLTL